MLYNLPLLRREKYRFVGLSLSLFSLPGKPLMHRYYKKNFNIDSISPVALRLNFAVAGSKVF